MNVPSKGIEDPEADLKGPNEIHKLVFPKFKMQAFGITRIQEIGTTPASLSGVATNRSTLARCGIALRHSELICFLGQPKAIPLAV